MKKWLIILAVVAIVVGLNEWAKKEEAHRLNIVKEVTGHTDARIVWSEGMSDGEVRNFTYWNGDKCQAVIGIRGDDSYYVSESHCSSNKLTKD